MQEDRMEDQHYSVKTEIVPNSPDEFLFDYCPWLFFTQASKKQRALQTHWLALLAQNGQRSFGIECFVSKLAAVFTDKLALGDGSYIAAHAYLTGDVSIGSDCTLNPYVVVRGPVTMGNGVRIGTHSSLIGFNHHFQDTSIPMHIQGITSLGITIGSDVWIGSNVTILDGVTVGDHSVLAAGAVVVRDVPPFTIVGGVPAKVIRYRRAEDRPDSTSHASREDPTNTQQRSQSQEQDISRDLQKRQISPAGSS